MLKGLRKISSCGRSAHLVYICRLNETYPMLQPRVAGRGFLRPREFTGFALHSRGSWEEGFSLLSVSRISPIVRASMVRWSIRRRAILCVVLLALSVFSLGAFAASEYHGQVTFGGLPVPGATVTATATQGDKKSVSITDQQGLFSFSDLTDGTWTIEVE